MNSQEELELNLGVQNMEQSSCAICLSSEGRLFPLEITGSPGVQVCSGCGAMYSQPRYTRDEIEAFYQNEFASDPGALKYHPGLKDTLEDTDFNSSLKQMRPMLYPIIQRFVPEINGKKWLELRFRTGAVLKIVEEMGAVPFGVDIFEGNVQAAKKRFSRDSFYTASVHDLMEPLNGYTFDVISALSIHVLCHTPEPVDFLRSIRSHLNDEGIIILEDKDVTRVPVDSTIYPLAAPNPIAHFHHTTFTSAIAMVRRAGFDILHADFYERSSALAHFLIVARKGHETAVEDLPKEDPDEIYRTMLDLHAQMNADID